MFLEQTRGALSFWAGDHNVWLLAVMTPETAVDGRGMRIVVPVASGTPMVAEAECK